MKDERNGNIKIWRGWGRGECSGKGPVVRIEANRSVWSHGGPEGGNGR